MAFNLYPSAADGMNHQSLTDFAVVLDLDSTLIHSDDLFDEFIAYDFTMVRARKGLWKS